MTNKLNGTKGAIIIVLFFDVCFYSILDPPENVVLTTNATANKACQNDVVRFNCSADAVPSAMSFQLFKD